MELSNTLNFCTISSCVGVTSSGSNDVCGVFINTEQAAICLFMVGLVQPKTYGVPFQIYYCSLRVSHIYNVNFIAILVA